MPGDRIRPFPPAGKLRLPRPLLLQPGLGINVHHQRYGADAGAFQRIDGESGTEVEEVLACEEHGRDYGGGTVIETEREDFEKGGKAISTRT